MATIILSAMGNNVSIVVPTYSSHAFIRQSLVVIIEHALPLFNQIELVVVDDASAIDIESHLHDLATDRVAITYIKLQHNQGQFWSTNVGIVNARYDYIITIDDDLSYSPAHMGQLVSLAPAGNFMVYATVKKSAFLHLARRIVFWLAGKKMGASFRYFNKGLINDPNKLNVPIDAYIENLPDNSYFYKNIYIPNSTYPQGLRGKGKHSLLRKVGLVFSYTYMYPYNKLPYLVALGLLLAYALRGYGIVPYLLLPLPVLLLVAIIGYYLKPLKRRVGDIEYVKKEMV